MKKMEPKAVVPLRAILDAQNRDGGWGYHGGSSWTEPTSYALLALLANGRVGEPIDRGMAWLAHVQREDGGWPPNGAVNQSTWVTALAIIVCAGRTPNDSVIRASEWLLRQSGRESAFTQRVRGWLLGVHEESDISHQGWAWYPGASSWVMPTAMSILALEKVQRMSTSPEIGDRIKSGRDFLLARRCGDGGWNHGAPRALGQGAASYPETTGIALLALHGVAPSVLSRSIGMAERHLLSCASAEGCGWLELGLMAQGRPVPAHTPASPRRISDLALLAIVAAASEGRNVLVG